MPQFIETQFPIARLSAEAYKERKANNGQTLTRLGKWWGRKPLILVRAAIVGMLMPASDDPKRDREIFLKILTMDDAGAWQRCKGEIPVAAWREAAPPEVLEEHFTARGWQRGLTDEEKESACNRILESLNSEGRKALDDQRRRPVPDRNTFDALPYAERITHCERPENIEGPTPDAWAEINAHLGTNATSLSELVVQLGQRTFGHTPRVGDAFCGGGSIPFEASRIGCEAFGSDLNPVAAFLTWANLHLLGGGPTVQRDVMIAQVNAYRDAEQDVLSWGIEHNAAGEQAQVFLYCIEVKPEGCEYFIPLAPSWVITEKYRIVCKWVRVPDSDRLTPEIVTVSPTELGQFKDGKGATIVNSRVIDPFNTDRSWSFEALRGASGLRRWTNDDIVPRKTDVFQERLYCIRWIDSTKTLRYAAPDEADLEREAKVTQLLREYFPEWQRQGFIPSKAIPEGGDKTEEPIRTRGWTHWHHLFTPRQLLVNGLLASKVAASQRICIADIGRLANANSRLTIWYSAAGKESVSQTFSNQALNTNFNYAGRSLSFIRPIFFDSTSLDGLNLGGTFGPFEVLCSDARDLRTMCDIWVTDPPYADAINYHELADFFLAWYDKQLAHAFPEWTPDARAELAVRGDGDAFRRSMVEIYHNLANHMPDNGMQMVMFTHQDPTLPKSSSQAKRPTIPRLLILEFQA